MNLKSFESKSFIFWQLSIYSKDVSEVTYCFSFANQKLLAGEPTSSFALRTF